MDRKLGTEKQSRRKLVSFTSEKGYLMLSTLFLLVLTGIFLQSVIKISANNIIQLNQISSAYQAKAALNMSERILKDHIVANNELPRKVELSSSIGNIQIVKNTGNSYKAVITHENGVQFSKEIAIEGYENEEEEPVDQTELLNKDSCIPNQAENILAN